MHPSTNFSASDLPLFPLGILVCTSGVDQLVQEGLLDPLVYVFRHLSGDWGDMDEDDIASNASAIELGRRIVSSYQIVPSIKIWIITEGDRSVTTILLPDEY